MIHILLIFFRVVLPPFQFDTLHNKIILGYPFFLLCRPYDCDVLRVFALSWKNILCKFFLSYLEEDKRKTYLAINPAARERLGELWP